MGLSPSVCSKLCNLVTLPLGGHLVDRTESTISGGSPEIGLTVEVAISAQDQPTERVGAVRIVELVDHGKFSLRRDGKDRTVTASVPEI